MIVQRKRGDTRPLEARLLRRKKSVPLAGATVRWLMQPAPGSAGIALSAAVAVTDATKGKVLWTPQPEDVAVAGVYRAEFEVIFGNGVRETWPTDGWIDFELLADVVPEPSEGIFSDVVSVEVNAEPAEDVFSDEVSVAVS